MVRIRWLTGLNMRTVMPLCDVVIGTEEEFMAALSSAPEAVMAGEKATDRAGLQRLLLETCAQCDLTLVVKRGPRGLSVLRRDCVVDVPGYPVEIVNTVGAGDGFASGLIAGRARGWDWERAARFANACGALVVTRHGCARALPYWPEVEDFIAEREKAGE